MMIEEIFIKLQKKEQIISDKELDYLKEFIKDEIVIKENEAWSISSKYRVGRLKLKNKDALLEDLLNIHKNIKIDFESLNGAYEGDLVLVKRIFNPRVKYKGKVLKILDANEREMLIYKKGKKLFSVKESIELSHIKLKPNDLEDGDIFLLNSKTSEIKEILGNIKDASIDEKISMILYEEAFRLSENFEVDAKMDDTNSRVDLTALPFCTIDPASAKDHDDAIYYDKQNHILFVAIADVSYFVKEESALDKSAYIRSSSIYLPNKVYPMLPKELSEQMCSLKEGEDRYSFVFKLHLDENNSVKKSELFEAIINSHKKFSYGRIDRVLEGQLDKYDETQKLIFDYLVPLYEITKDIREKRLKDGYDFRSSENRLKLNRNFELEAIVEESSTASHQLIEECMLQANIEASKKVSTVGIYRVHEEPSFQAVSKLIDDVNLLGLKVKVKKSLHETVTNIQKMASSTLFAEDIDDLIIKSQSQAKYSSRNQGHFGLGFSSYSHFTSPIRRYSDLVLHRVLKSKVVPSGIDTICEHISNQERKIDKLVWDLEDRKYARWALKNIDKEFKVKIVDESKGIAKFYDKMTGLRVFIDNFKGQKLFSKHKVIIKDADIISKKIVASIKL